MNLFLLLIVGLSLLIGVGLVGLVFFSSHIVALRIIQISISRAESIYAKARKPSTSSEEPEVFEFFGLGISVIRNVCINQDGDVFREEIDTRISLGRRETEFVLIRFLSGKDGLPGIIYQNVTSKMEDVLSEGTKIHLLANRLFDLVQEKFESV